MRRQCWTTMVAALMLACTAQAQDGKKDGGGKDGKVFVEEPTLVYVQTLVNTFDADGNLTVEENELEKGFLAMLKKNDQRYKTLMTLFDADKDGKLNPQEGLALRRFVFGLAGLLRYDSNGDWTVDDKESDAIWAQMNKAYQEHNQGTLQKFDANGDGKLDDDETAAARKRIEEWRNKNKD